MAEHNHRLQIKDKHLVVRPKQEAVANSETKILLLKTPHAGLVCTLDWQDTVLLWLSLSKTDNLGK